MTNEEVQEIVRRILKVVDKYELIKVLETLDTTSFTIRNGKAIELPVYVLEAKFDPDGNSGLYNCPKCGAYADFVDTTTEVPMTKAESLVKRGDGLMIHCKCKFCGNEERKWFSE